MFAPTALATPPDECDRQFIGIRIRAVINHVIQLRKFLFISKNNTENPVFILPVYSFIFQPISSFIVANIIIWSNQKYALSSAPLSLFLFSCFFTNLIFTAATAARLLEFNEIKPVLFLPTFSENWICDKRITHLLFLHKYFIFFQWQNSCH